MLNKEIIYNQFIFDFSNLIKEETKNKNINNVTLLCIGTSKVIGDSIGPLVGTHLKQTLNTSNKITILGDCEKNIHYGNINEQINRINKNSFYKKTVIVIDSALSSKENIGKIILQNRALKYGEGIKKKSESIGNISIKAVIGENTNNRFINFYKLKKASVENVRIMADIISEGITKVMNLDVIWRKYLIVWYKYKFYNNC